MVLPAVLNDVQTLPCLLIDGIGGVVKMSDQHFEGFRIVTRIWKWDNTYVE